MKVDDKRALSTPQSAPHSSKMCAPKLCTLENNTTTPTLPQGAAAERQHHLQKKDVCLSLIDVMFSNLILDCNANSVVR